jgi:hypothetical protein
LTSLATADGSYALESHADTNSFYTGRLVSALKDQGHVSPLHSLFSVDLTGPVAAVSSAAQSPTLGPTTLLRPVFLVEVVGNQCVGGGKMIRDVVEPVLSKLQGQVRLVIHILVHRVHPDFR